jgi:hypothetical protein
MKYLRITAFIVSALLTMAALASTSTTVKPGDVVLRNQDNTIPAGYTATTSRFKTPEECKSAAATLGGTRKCDQSTLITTVATCADEPAPHIYLELIDVEGTKAWNLPASRWPEPDYVQQAWLYVHNPAWPLGYPACWVRGWEDPALWRENPKAEPGKVFMERIEPGMTAEDVEMPNSVEPVCKPDGPADCPVRA